MGFCCGCRLVLVWPRSWAEADSVPGNHHVSGVIPLEQLAALDLSLWLGTGKAAAEQLHTNQSTVSRQQLSGDIEN